ncbi:MAG: hypothetical protein B7Y83_01290 [Flavobacteriales bacterium 32-34-25]|nr:MAG: hypothetical protein B7Y83_01290 [Flavobacteriales bacterium 32-34-25]
MKKKKIITKLEVKHIIKKYKIRIGSYTIREDGLIDVRGSVKLTGNNFFKLPLKFGNVTGDFYCKQNGLGTLKGSPKYVGGNFNCSDNELTSLEGGPDYVGGSYFCNENNLINLKGCPVEVIGRFNCALNNLESLAYSPRRVGKSYHAHHNRLKTLNGAPAFVGGVFNVAANLLANLEGCPDYIVENFHFDCWLPSLYIGTKNCHVGGVKIESLERIYSGDSILPELIRRNQQHLATILKYNRYVPIYNENGQINIDDLIDLLHEVKNGMR